MSWKTPITLLVLLGVLLGAAFYGWQTIISPTPEKAPPVATKPRCDKVEEFHEGQRIRSRDIVVNVYNAGLIGGLASETLDSLKDRGFKAGVSDNAPDSVSATNVTIFTNDKRSPPAKLVASQFKGAVRLIKGDDLDPGIDIIVGDDFAGINKSAKRSIRLKRDVSTCASVDSAAS